MQSYLKRLQILSIHLQPKKISSLLKRNNHTLRQLSTAATTSSTKMTEMTDKEWKEKLTPAEYRVLRAKGTEAPGTGEYEKFYPKEGYFACRACGNPLYTFQAKFDSGCGWPAFDKCIKGSIKTHADGSLFMKRVEIVCAKCGGHQGHVFEGEGFTDTNERHCVNSISVKYVPGPVPTEIAAKGEEKVT
jgi:peptide-methionine (R)-S-oxide reductase